MDAKARLLAVEVLLADPEQLGNDALEGDLYILRDNLIHQAADAPASPGESDGALGAAGVTSAPLRRAG